MPKSFFRHYLVGAIFLVALCFSFYLLASFNQVVAGGNMAALPPRIEHLFGKTRTVCFGRFLIDVPVTATVVYGPAHVPWPIERYLGVGPKMSEVITKRLAEIEKEKTFAYDELREKDSMVGREIDGIVDGQKIVFGVSKASGVEYRIESYQTIGDDLFIQEATSFGAKEDYGNVIRELNVTAQLLRARTEQEIPVDPGVCIDGGFVKAYQSEFEIMSLGIRLADFSDVHFSISATKKDTIVESDALEPRLQQAEQDAYRMGRGTWYSRIKTLGRGRRQISNWHGFEVLARKPAQDTEGESHEFVFVSQGEPRNPLLPVLELELHTGVKGNQVGGVKPSVSDDEAVAIWNKLTASIRVRATSAQ